MGQQRRSFTPEFKQEAVDLCRRSGKSECQVARELGIPQPTFNRWMRQYFPKGTDLSRYSQADLNTIALRLNQRPRKTLGFQTPAAILEAAVASTA